MFGGAVGAFSLTSQWHGTPYPTCRKGQWLGPASTKGKHKTLTKIETSTCVLDREDERQRGKAITCHLGKVVSEGVSKNVRRIRAAPSLALVYRIAWLYRMVRTHVTCCMKWCTYVVNSIDLDFENALLLSRRITIEDAWRTERANTETTACQKVWFPASTQLTMAYAPPLSSFKALSVAGLIRDLWRTKK